MRLLLAALAYVLLERLRPIGLADNERARTQVWSLEFRRLEVGAVIVRNTSASAPFSPAPSRIKSPSNSRRSITE